MATGTLCLRKYWVTLRWEFDGAAGSSELNRMVANVC